MNVIKRLKIGARLALAFATVLVLLVGVAVVGLTGMDRVKAGLRTVYEDRTVCLGQLSEISRLMMRNRVLVMDMMINPTADNVKDRNSELGSNLEKINKQWADYTATYLTPEEKQLADEFAPLQKRYEQDGIMPMRDALLAGRTVADVNDIYTQHLRPTAKAAQAVMDKLVQLQIDVAAQEYQSASQAQSRSTVAAIVITVVAVALGVAIAWAITRSITRPVERAIEVANTVASGDLSSRIDVRGHDEIAQLMGALKTMNDSLVGIVSQVRLSSDSIATGSAQIATGNADLSQRTEEQASNLQQTAASMEEMNATVRQNADSAQVASQLATSASAVALKGGQVVADVVSTMQDITASSKRISEIITVIDGIAFQTNILALNAAVESARAGEHGRGFAVVAGEVRLLAQRSAEAAKEIKTLIGQSVENVDVGAQLVHNAGETMDELVDQVKRVADLIGEIGAATSEQRKGIGQVADAVNQLDHVTQQNAALVEESAAAAESLKHQAFKLTEAVSVFRLDRT